MASTFIKSNDPGNYCFSRVLYWHNVNEIMNFQNIQSIYNHLFVIYANVCECMRRNNMCSILVSDSQWGDLNAYTEIKITGRRLCFLLNV